MPHLPFGQVADTLSRSPRPFFPVPVGTLGFNFAPPTPAPVLVIAVTPVTPTVMVDCDVLIVGAGPVGTALALELAHQEISFRIVDKAATRSGQSRAFAVQPRTLELLNRHSDATWYLSNGQPLRAFTMISSKKRVTSIEFEDFGRKDTLFQLPIIIPQASTEQFLDDGLSRYGKAVERPVSVAAEDISQDENGVTTILKHPDGTSETVISK